MLDVILDAEERAHQQSGPGFLDWVRRPMTRKRCRGPSAQPARRRELPVAGMRADCTRPGGKCGEDQCLVRQLGRVPGEPAHDRRPGARLSDLSCGSAVFGLPSSGPPFAPVFATAQLTDPGQVGG